MPVIPLSRALDTALDRSVVPGFSKIGYAVRRRLPTWPADPAIGALAGRHVAVTGATSGLGTATARQLSDLGAHVHLVVRNPDKAVDIAAQLRGPSTTWTCDIGDLDSVRECAAKILAEGPPLDGLVHNAGAMPPERTDSRQGHEMTMAIHVLGPLLMTELLLDQLAAGTTLEEAQSMVLDYVRAWVPEAGRAPLGGNTVATDRAFLVRDMPELEAHLHYRIIDVSSIKELSRRWFPRAYFAAPQKSGGHRALADIKESIAQLRYYREAVFVPPPGPSTEQARALAARHVRSWSSAPTGKRSSKPSSDRKVAALMLRFAAASVRGWT